MTLRSPVDGTVSEVSFQDGDLCDTKSVLVVIEANAPDSRETNLGELIAWQGRETLPQQRRLAVRRGSPTPPSPVARVLTPPLALSKRP